MTPSQGSPADGGVQDRLNGEILRKAYTEQYTQDDPTGHFNNSILRVAE